MGNSADHAILSPSGASRWLACTPSARLEQQFPNSSSAAAAEGTLAHALGELMILHKHFGVGNYAERLAEIQAHELYNEDMHSHIEDYSNFVMEQYNTAKGHTKDAVLLLEQKLDLTAFIPEGFGTGDVVIIADHTLDFTDLKYGKGVPVSAHENKQMMLYALGALHEFGYMYDIKKVRMTIYQPRLDSISTYELMVEELMDWAHNELKPKAQLAFNGEGEYAPGDACRFCRAKAVCRAHAEYNLQIAKYDFMDPQLLSDDEIADILSRADNFTKWLNAVSEHALAEAVNNGKRWPGYKLVEGRSNRAYTDTDAILNVLTTEAGFDASRVTEPLKLLPVTKLEKAISKAAFEKHVNPFVVKPPGKPALVPASDKRPEYNSTEGAALDFAGTLNEELL